TSIRAPRGASAAPLRIAARGPYHRRVRSAVFPHVAFPDYALLDSGEAEKLERFGQVLVRRPDPQALWPHGLDEREWMRADLAFVRESDRGGRWVTRKESHGGILALFPSWSVHIAGAT